VADPLHVEILFTPSCPHGRASRGRIEALAQAEGIEVVVTETLLGDLRDAEARRFTGSPTVLVEGRDVEPRAADAPADVGLG
jgi:hypothetical protein